MWLHDLIPQHDIFVFNGWTLREEFKEEHVWCCHSNRGLLYICPSTLGFVGPNESLSASPFANVTGQLAGLAGDVVKGRHQKNT